MKNYSTIARSCFGFVCWAGAIGAVTFATSAVAQIVPDNTLGIERSTVTPAAIRGLPSDRIDGGAIRGSNLFHSFQQFNIGEGRGAYFTNPAGIENILSRVTGNSRSDILGRLGVLGNANLFLINPNGIVFGANASLDVAGSFTATTANAIALGDQDFFSATQPDKSSLLAITPGALFFDQQVRQPKTIQNSGNLTAGRDLTLAADNLELQGQVRSGGNLTLQAQDTLRIRDSVTAPFIVSAGENLLVQGDQSVDIFALNHSDSGLFSGGNMVLRSANTVGGDAHYYSGGNFRIEQLNGSLGALYSPYDPVIRVTGDVFINAYQGSSLHILAGGKVEIPNGIVITSSDATDGLIETVKLSDETLQPVVIDGKNVPTVDIRAGVNPTFVGTPVLTGTGIFTPPTSTTDVPSSADIRLGAIIFVDATATPTAGNLLVTNQYQPNRALAGDIRLSSIFNGSFTGGGSISADSRGNLEVVGVVSAGPSLAATGTVSGNGGNITFLATKNIIVQPDLSISPTAIISSTGLLGGTLTFKSGGNINMTNAFIVNASADSVPGFKGGNINFTAQSLSLTNSLLSTRATGRVDAGDIKLDIANDASVSGFLRVISPDGTTTILRGGIESIVRNGAIANGGTIDIKAGSLSLTDNAGLDSSTNGQGSAGNVFIFIRNDILLKNNSFISSNVGAGGIGNAGNISITANNLTLRNEGQIQSALVQEDRLLGLPAAQGKAGNLQINLTGNLFASGLIRDNDGNVFPSGVFTRASLGTTGENGSPSQEGGNIFIAAKSVTLDDDALIDAATFGQNRAGDIQIDVSQLILRNGGQITSGSGKQGIPGEDFGPGGNTKINARESIDIDGRGGIASRSGVFSDTSSRQDAGDITINTKRLSIWNGGGVGAGASGSGSLGGNGGDLSVTATESITLTGQEVRRNGSRGRPSVLTTEARVKGDSGRLTINTGQLTIHDGAAILSLVTLGAIDANGNLLRTIGNANDIDITANSIEISDPNSRIESSTFGTGNAGNILLQVAGPVSISEGYIASVVGETGVGNAGNIVIQAGSLNLSNQGTITAQSAGIGEARNIQIAVRDEFRAVDGTILTSAQTSGGNVGITAKSIRLEGDSDIQTNVVDGQGGNITLTADSILAFNDSDILTFAEQQGKGGNISLNTPAFFGQNYRPNSPPPFDGNNRVDINASGTVSGIITVPDTTFIQNSLTQLAQNLIDPNTLLANSCIVRRRDRSSNGTFLVTGSGGLPVRPGDAPPASFPTGEVRSLPSTQTKQAWQPGDPIVEPQGIYRLANGKLVMSRECEP